MKEIINQIFVSELNKKVDTISEISGLGLVNKVFDVICENKNYIVRINPDRNKEFEFWKEKWCMEKASSLDIPSPEVISVGVIHDLPFMIMNKIKGSNGSLCSLGDKLSIWRRLGEYASKFHDVKRIDELKISTDEFHPNWKGKLEYNIAQLNKYDSLLQKEVFKKDEHKLCRALLDELKERDFSTGLIHADLSPRNVIVYDETVVLLDWGSSKIDVTPHAEIGIVQTNNNLNSEEFEAFLNGYGMSNSDCLKIENEINLINLLNSLDLYRWAEGSDFQEIDKYARKLRVAFEKISN